MPEIFAHPFTPDLNVAIVYDDEDLYNILRERFKTTHAFLIHEDKLVVVDGEATAESWFTADHLFVILAHELGHWMAGHSGENVKEEQEADWLGWKILIREKKSKAAMLMVDLFRERYGIRPQRFQADHLAKFFS